MSLTKLISQVGGRSEQVRSGTVARVLGSGRYLVRSGSRSVSVRSSTPWEVGQRVVIGQLPTGELVGLGRDRDRGLRRTEVRVDG